MYLSLVDDIKYHVGMFVLQAVTQGCHVRRVVGKAAVRLDNCQWHGHARRPTYLTPFVHLQHSYTAATALSFLQPITQASATSHKPLNCAASRPLWCTHKMTLSQHAVVQFSKSRVWVTVPEGSILILGDTTIFLQPNVGWTENSPYAKNKLNPLSYYDRTPTCDR